MGLSIAINAVKSVPGNSTMDDIRKRTEVLATLAKLNNAHLSKMATEGTNLLGHPLPPEFGFFGVTAPACTCSHHCDRFR